MASYFDAFRNLKKRAMQLTVQWPPALPAKGEPGDPDYFPGLKPEIEFTVKRLNQVQLNNAVFAGEAHARDVRGCKPTDDDFEDQKSYSAVYKLSEYLIPHITDWKLLDRKETPPFNKEEVEEFIMALSIPERVMFGRSYRMAAAEDEKKTTGEVTSEPDSSTPSESDSSTS